MNFILKIIMFMDYLLVPLHLQSERLFILRSAEKIFKELELRPIPIIYDDCPSCYHSPIGNYIGIGINFLGQDWNEVFDYINGKFESREGKLFFIIAHEIAHYLQYSKYPKWKTNALALNHNELMELKFKGRRIRNERYRKLRIEANADRIALIFSKKFGYCT